MQDTETLLALVCSLLTLPVPEPDILLDALLSCDGDVHATAELLNSAAADVKESKPVSSDSKRKYRSTGLDGWLNTGKAEATVSDSPRKKPILVGSSFSPMNNAIKDTPSGSSSPTRPKVNLLSVLRPPPVTTRSIPRPPPLTLMNPSMVAQHTPCTMHLSVLPPELACRLFYTMLDLSESWKRNKWWLFDQVVESPHRTSFYARKTDGIDSNKSWQEDAGQFWYHGRRTESPEVFPDAMEEACAYVERIVNNEMHKRTRLPLEWAGSDSDGQIWRANVAASNRYEGTKESVGFHSDQLTYLGPYPTIASLSLGTTRIFRLREVVPSDENHSRKAQTLNIPLPHNSLIVMHAGTQEKFKHSIPPQPTIDLYRPPFPHPSRQTSPPEPSNCRINITFRFYRPDFRPQTIPRCHCGVPTVLRPDMKNSHDSKMDKYWWACYAGVQNEGRGCSFWQIMDMEAEGRGPTVNDSIRNNKY